MRSVSSGSTRARLPTAGEPLLETPQSLTEVFAPFNSAETPF